MHKCLTDYYFFQILVKELPLKSLVAVALDFYWFICKDISLETVFTENVPLYPLVAAPTIVILGFVESVIFRIITESPTFKL